MPVNDRSQLLGFQRSYAFVIGIDHYPKINQDLKSAVNDARAIARALRQRQGFDHVELFVAPLPGTPADQLLTGMDGVIVHQTASGAALRDLLVRLADPDQEPRIQPSECVVFYFAGHGKPGEFGAGPAGYLLPSDARPEKAMLQNDSLLPMEEVFQTLKALDCHHTLLILDCCFAGKFRLVNQNTRDAGWVTDLPLYEERFQRYVNERAWQVLVSAGPHQTAADWLGDRSELDEGQHSPFAAGLIDALEGKVMVDLRQAGRRRGDGVLTSQELYLHLWDRVERLTNDGNFDRDIQYPDLFPMGDHRGGQFIFFDPDNPLNFAERELRNPYRGLAPYEPEHSDLFFGRRAVIRELLQKLAATDLLLLSGPSGSGKSSLAKAGLYPQLLTWTDERGEQPWSAAELLILRPGDKPWSGEPVYVPDADPPRLQYFSGLAALLTQLDDAKQQLLLIDQYEELFTEGAPETERNNFEQELIRLLPTAADRNLKIVLTLRSDFEWLFKDSAFGSSLWNQLPLASFLYRVPPLGLDELHEALVLPAAAELYDFETEELVQLILSEIGYAPGALPLLSFTMSRFYEITDKDKRMFTLPGYRELGGVNGALSTYADGVYAQLTPPQQQIMHKLFLRMVKLVDGGYARRRVYVRPGERFQPGSGSAFLNEFDYADQEDAIVQEVLAILEQQQLILGGSDRVGAYYEPIHDALIQHWATGRQWIADFGADNLDLQRQLWKAVLDSTRRAQAQPDNFYGADVDDGVEQDDSLTGSFSKLWESNVKLLQVIRQITAGAKAYLLSDKDSIIQVALPHIAAEDHAKFIAFWDDCYDKGIVPDLNSIILSGYSDKLLDLCLQNGDHWLNEAESDFVRQSWDKRIAEILEMKRQRNEAREARERTVNELIEASWKTGVYLDPEKRLLDADGYERLGGVRDLYARLKLLMSLDKARSISPVPVFVSGPHQEDFNENGVTFGYYNPAFLKWAQTRVIPASRKPVLRRLTQPFFDAFLRDMARTYYLTYQYLEDHAELRNYVQAEYLAFVESGALLRDDTEPFTKESSGGIFLESYFEAYPWENKEYFETFLGEIAYFNWVVSCGFWIRRHIDTTAAAFKSILDELLQTYDPEWLANPPDLPDAISG
jgi:hypothetical protein